MLKIAFNTTRFKKDLDSFIKHEQNALEETTKEAANNIASDAKYLDSDVPSIANSISVEKEEKGYSINKGGNTAHPELAAYSEFGTGDYAGALLSNYPQDWKDMAKQFFVNGKGRLPAKPSLYGAFNRHINNIANKAAEKIG